MNNKLDVFEILGVNETKDQKPESVSDPDFSEAIRQFAALQEAKTSQQTKKVKQEPEKKKGKIKKQSRDIRRTLIKLAVVLIVVLLFFNFAVSIQKVSGISMVPEFKDDDKVAVSLLTRNYSVGDVIVFKAANDKIYMKRIVAKAGDTVDIPPEGGLYINGNAVEETAIYVVTTRNDVSVNYPVLLSDDTYFVLGDNREHSTDSRNTEIGVVNKKDIIGKVIFCFRKI